MISRRGLAVLIAGVVAIAILVRVGLSLTSRPAENTIQTATSSPSLPLVAMSGLQLPDSVRYSVGLRRPLDQALTDVQVEVRLPPETEVRAMLDTPGYTQLLEQQDRTLRWTAPEFPAGEYPDPFTFTLQQPPNGDFAVRVRWGGAAPGEVDFSGRPAVAVAGREPGDLILGPDGTGGTFRPVGASGVLVGVAPGVLAAETKVQAQWLGNEADPPAATSDLWWCAMAELTGLPAGASVAALVPLRQPLPPDAWLRLFALRDGRWEELPEKGLVTFDGQYVQLIHSGGRVAAGSPPTARPQVTAPAMSSKVASKTDGAIPSKVGNKADPAVPSKIESKAGAVPPRDFKPPVPQPTGPGGKSSKVDGGQVAGQFGQFGQSGQAQQFGQSGQLGTSGVGGAAKDSASKDQAPAGGVTSKTPTGGVPTIPLPPTSGAQGIADMLQIGRR